MPEQLVILIGSDGKRAIVSRFVATQASLVLRDLLDGREPTTRLREGFANDVNDNTTNTNTTSIVSEGQRMNDNSNNGSSNNSIPAIELPFPYFTGSLLKRICAHMTYRYNHQPPNRNSSGSTAAGVVNSNNDNNKSGSNFSSYCGRNIMREIPRPMVLPLAEYLDAYDRHFIEDWDEVTTILMVKAATLLNYEELLNLASARLAVYLSEKSIESLRAFLGVESDFSPEEEAELRKEYEKCMEDR
ncbi:S-phase kinase-associated protein 1 [Trypanosoma theileri]|uniref:S-phase kinase-associated protein 1 n=1 Tax=Trypanosoma theileri TaxID=67003 RepID=A0A1X0P0U8_9TRYP|nr:S-phase kinase-associated protein 1 [Trypanosoma theileri]ORC90554.1 S-phase kinase-associated protein 1 [Trypanosoma theileri]